MLDQVSPRRGALELYIDAGPLARARNYTIEISRPPPASSLNSCDLASHDAVLGAGPAAVTQFQVG